MSFNFSLVRYDDLNPHQKENYNFMKVSAVLADYGFVTMRVTDDWQGADFIAQHISGEFLRVQLKSRLTFAKKYQDKKDLYVAFPYEGTWYLYPHNDLLDAFLTKTKMGESDAWKEHGEYSFPHLSETTLLELQPYRLDSGEGTRGFAQSAS
jgi:hypothetical protein